MVSKEFAKSQIDRLKGLKEWPNLRSELRRKLMEAESEYHAEQSVTRAIDGSRFGCPTPYDLGEFMAQAPRRPKAGPCSLCDGDGWIFVERNGYKGVRRCECLNGCK